MSDGVDGGRRTRPAGAPEAGQANPAETGEPLPTSNSKRKRRASVLAIQGRLTEWHALDDEARQRQWADLVHWVAWLYDFYELGREYRLPSCWPRHPGLVQELWVLKCEREALFTTDVEAGVTSGERAGSLAQHARTWHTELRSLIGAIGFYAPKCFTEHSRGELLRDHGEADLVESWLDIDPLDGVAPPVRLSAEPEPSDDEEPERQTDEGGSDESPVTLSERQVNEALAARTAQPHPAVLGVVSLWGSWWLTDADTETWEQVVSAQFARQLDILAANVEPGIGDLE